MSARSHGRMGGWIVSERRTKRSSDRFVALRYQLERSRDDADLEALVLGDDDGLVVASSGDKAVCAELAAVAPLVERSILGLPMPPLLTGADVLIERLQVDGQALYLAAVGGAGGRRAALRHSIRGVQRILAAN